MGFDCDNGSEFLNWHIAKHYLKRKNPVRFTRSRPYFKNDNAHIEEKNWTHIRQFLGYQRFDKVEIVDLLNDLYDNEWRLFFNFFMPSVKLLTKSRVGSKIKKKYDSPKTPFQRVIESPLVSDERKDCLEKVYRTLNPFELQKSVHSKIAQILKLAML